MGYQQPFPANGMANQPSTHLAANAQPQQKTSSLTVSTPALVAFNISGTLDPRQEQARDEVINSFVNANFNRKGTITLLKFLVNNELPNYSEKPEAKRFNDKLGNCIHSYEKILASTGEQRNTRWTFECVCRIAQKQLNSPEMVTLMDKFLSEDPESIANWLNMLY